MVWDFLNTFHKVLLLTPISLSDFVVALTFSYTDNASTAKETDSSNIPDPTSSVPLYLSEAHLSLLKLLLADQRSDEWWWSTLPDESEAMEPNPQDLKHKASPKQDNSDDESEEESEDEETHTDKGTPKMKNEESKDKMGLSFAVPPSIVDLLLPPAKPSHDISNSSLLISSFTWPYIVGTSARRFLSHLQKLRLDVDDYIRANKRCKGLAHLTLAEQQERQKISIERIFTECMCTVDGSDISAELEDAIESLCNPISSSSTDQQHGIYAALSPLQKLAILRILVEAAYDTSTVSQLIADNFNARASALKSLENEERKLKKQAKEEAMRDEELAREYLASDIKEAFYKEKRDELLNEKRFTAANLLEMTDEELINTDPEIRVEYDALPTGASFSKSQVMSMVEKIQEAAAFDTHHLTVLTLDDIVAR